MTDEVTGGAVIVSAADAPYFPLLADLVESVQADSLASRLKLAVLDLGLTGEQRDWLTARKAQLAVPGWDVDFPGRDRMPSWFRAQTARPFLPKYFPGHDIYLWIDADAWVQDGRVLTWYLRAARRGLLAITPELDRSYVTSYKRPKILGWGQNFRAYRYSYGFRVADRLARNPILNVGVLGLSHDAPHWTLWGAALERGLTRRRLRRPQLENLSFKLCEQTALNYVVFHDRAPATFLPAAANWFCGKGTPMYDTQTGRLVEPHEPHEAIGIVHLAGHRIQDKAFSVKTLQGGAVTTRLTYGAIRSLREGQA